MRPPILLLALACLTFTVSPASAAGTATAPPVQFQGLQYAPLGACVADLNGDGRLDLVAIGSSGQDGVSVSCLHVDGMRLVLDGECTAADAGASLALTFSVAVAGTTLHPRLSVASAPAACIVQPELSSLSSSTTQIFL